MPSGEEPPTRAEVLEAERRAKEPVPPERTRAEKALGAGASANGFMTRFRGLHFDGGDFPSGAGFAYGIGLTDRAIGSLYEHPDDANRIDAHVSASWSTKDYLQVGADVALRNIGDAPFNIAIEGLYYEHPEEDFFGFGPDSSETDRSSYLMEGTAFEAKAWFAPRRFRIGGGAGYLQPEIGPGKDDRLPSSEDLFDDAIDSWFEQSLGFLGGVSADRGEAAMAAVDQHWWDSNARLPDPNLVLRRSLQIGPRIEP